MFSCSIACVLRQSDLAGERLLPQCPPLRSLGYAWLAGRNPKSRWSHDLRELAWPQVTVLITGREREAICQSYIVRGERRNLGQVKYTHEETPALQQSRHCHCVGAPEALFWQSQPRRRWRMPGFHLRACLCALGRAFRRFLATAVGGAVIATR